jgi:O-antigen/teichoic acid export membrane protein
MIRDFFRDSAIYGSAKALTGAITFLSLPIYTRALAPGEYGVIDMLTSVAAVVHVTVACEIAQGLARYVSSPESAPLRKSYASTALWFTLLAYSLFVAAMLPLAGRISLFLFETTQYVNVVRVAGLVAWGTGGFYLIQALLRFERMPVRFAIITLVYSLTSVAVTLVLLLVVHAGLIALFLGQLVATLIAVTLGLVFARSAIAVEFSRERCREMLTFSIPLVPSGVGIMLCLYVDRYAVLRLLSVADLGVYAVAARLAAVIPIAITGFQFALSPLVYQHHHEPETPRNLAQLFAWFLVVALPILTFLGIFSTELVRVVAPASYAGGNHLVFALGVALLLSGVYVFSPGLWVAKRTRAIALISVVTGVLNLGLNFFFIPHMGLVGAAVATLVSALVGATLHFTLGQKSYFIPFQWRRIAAGTAIAVLGGLLGLVRVGDGRLSLLVIGARLLTWIVVSGVCAIALVGLPELLAVASRLRPGEAGRASPLT